MKIKWASITVNLLMSGIIVSAVALRAAVPVLKLPATVAGVQTSDATSPTLYFLDLTGAKIPAGDSLTNTIYAVWCANPSQINGKLPPGPGAVSYTVYSSYATNLPTTDGNAGIAGGGLTQAQEMSVVNYILNYPRGKAGNIATTTIDVQATLWQVLHPTDGINYLSGAGTDGNAGKLYTEAVANGTFIPSSSQVIAVILDPGFPYQGVIIPVRSLCLLSAFGPAGAFGILGLQGSTIQLSSGPLQVNANVGIGANGNIHLSGGATLQSILYADNSATVQIDGGSAFHGGVIRTSFAAIQAAAIAEATSAASLPATQTYGNVTNALNIIGNGGQNVIDINGQLHLSGGNQLTISGGANDTFIINITQGFQLDGGANVVLSGVSPNQVLFNFIGNQQVQTSGKANTAGIFLAPNANIQINGGIHNSEFISGGNLSFQSNPVVNGIPSCGPGSVQLTCPASIGTIGTPYSSALIASNGVPPYVYSITSGSLPPGLMLNFPTPGAITGTPTLPVGTYTFNAKVVDSSFSQAGTAVASCPIKTSTNNYVCVIPPSGTVMGATSWNSFSAPSSAVVWLNLHLQLQSTPSTTTKTTVALTGGTFVVNSTTYGIPDGYLIFDPTAPATPTTSFNASQGPNGAWTTTFNPSNLSDEIFINGAAIPVSSNITNSSQANISFTTDSTDNTLKFQWQWGAAVFTYWPNNNSANILPNHVNGLQAGTPQNATVQQSLIGGPRGGGGSNYTGSWSATGQGMCPGAH